MNDNQPAPITPTPSLPERARASANRRRSEVRSLRYQLSTLKQRYRSILRYFASEDPTFSAALMPAMIVASLVFVRSPATNYIFDEQEALLANPYVNGKGMHWWEAFHRDFWGLASDRSIGSYRPIPNVIWRALWPLGQSPWVLHWVNILIHAVCAALLASLCYSVQKQRRQAWLTGALYLVFAVLTEAVTGVVGLADVLAALAVIVSLHAIRTSLWLVAPAVFLACLLGLFSKESAIVAVGLLPLAALLLSRTLDVPKPRALLRALLAGVAATAALVLYTELRRRWFPFESAGPGAGAQLPQSSSIARAFQWFLHWFHQPRLPADPMNNPLVSADLPHRVAGALRVYASGFMQLLVPLRLSGDYSFPSEPVPARLVFPGSVAGVALLVLPVLAGAVLWITAIAREIAESRGPWSPVRRVQGNLRSLALGLFWFPLAYFPLSNIPVVLPTVRAERFWIIPAIGVAILLGVLFERLMSARKQRTQEIAMISVVVYCSFQALQARLHACDYADDLSFWQAAARAVPKSAKAHLNYAVMLGTRSRMEERLKEGAIAQQLAPKWPMAHVYQGDALCRMKRYDEALPHYLRGFEIGQNEPNLIALGLQCLWDGGQIKPHESELQALLKRADDRSWLSYLISDILHNGDEHHGVNPKYRPRGYNEGPKK